MVAGWKHSWLNLWSVIRHIYSQVNTKPLQNKFSNGKRLLRVANEDCKKSQGPIQCMLVKTYISKVTKIKIKATQSCILYILALKRYVLLINLELNTMERYLHNKNKEFQIWKTMPLICIQN